ncbi:hypothetical protein [Nostoc cycadae]|uniref:Uncharacterized protein n=1 Tax=Nostoc cycadae WK-1 TaxID=1861711 RepID=A0A2H6LGC0_9NOSO|nr:hypothetical protein [Nostoc cycadae]GBE92262.1 hypothetical protein NCWK1_2016 [Nostoc cycadae WK-1]
MSKDSQTNQSMDNKDDSFTKSDLIQEFYLERYKYILQEIRSLNENIHKYLTLFQTLATAIATAGVALFVGRQQLNLTPEITKVALQGLLGLLVILAAFVVFSIVAGIFSWLDYRTEEVELLNKVVGVGFRKLPKKSNFWRWQETYVLFFVVIVVIIIISYVQSYIIPLIK